MAVEAGGARANPAPRARIALIFGVTAVVVALAGLHTPAFAHAERVSSHPEEGDRLKEAPSKVSIEFSEPPAADASLQVVDGCGNDVAGEVQVANQGISVPIDGGQPGKWKVDSTVVSGLDGHETRDSWTFSVGGKADCSQGGGGGRARGGGDEDESSFPVIPVVIGAVVVLAVALLLRAVTGRSED